MNVPGSTRIIAVLFFSLILVLFLLFTTFAHGPSDDADLHIFMPEVFRRAMAPPKPTRFLPVLTPIGPITPMPGGPNRPPPAETPPRSLTESHFLPMVKNNHVPPPSPVLDAISNADGGGTYTVAWSIAIGAAAYVLQEDDSPSFRSPTDVYSGPGKSKVISGRGIGTYYYRVKATNMHGSSPWSNVASVQVTQVAMPTPTRLFPGDPTLRPVVTPTPQPTHHSPPPLPSPLPE